MKNILCSSIIKMFYYEIFYDSLIHYKRGKGRNLKLSMNEISGIDIVWLSIPNIYNSNLPSLFSITALKTLL